MSGFNTAIGTVIAAAMATGVLQAVLPSVPPIDVHSIEYADGIVTQSRTVTTDGPTFFAEWHAEVIDARTDQPACGGSGAWKYTAGYLAAEMDLGKWSGDPACLSLPPGEYYLRAAWVWGDSQTSKVSDTFRIE